MDPTSTNSSPQGTDPDSDPGREQVHDNSILRIERPEGDAAKLLAAASLVIRSMPLDKALRKAARPEPLAGAGGDSRPAPEHPDARAVIEECRRRWPGCLTFGDAAIREAYVGLLQDRLCPIRVVQRFADEHPEIARRVFANIAAVVPRTHAGERLLIWGELRRLHPAAAGDEGVPACVEDPAARHSAEEIILLLNRLLGPRERRYLLACVRSWGPWSDSLLGRRQNDAAPRPERRRVGRQARKC